MLTLGANFTWTDKLAIAAALVVAAMLGIGAFSAVRFRLSRRRDRPPADADSDELLVYPREGLLSVLPLLVFNILVVFLAFYASWPMWLRLVIALPFLFMGGVCLLFACVLIIDQFRRRREFRSSDTQPPTERI